VSFNLFKLAYRRLRTEVADFNHIMFCPRTYDVLIAYKSIAKGYGPDVALQPTNMSYLLDIQIMLDNDRVVDRRPYYH
jgi:hypothetical protein